MVAPAVTSASATLSAQVYVPTAGKKDGAAAAGGGGVGEDEPPPQPSNTHGRSRSKKRTASENLISNRADLPPPFFGSADSKGLTNAICGSADPKGLAGGQLRPKQGKTLRLSVSADSEEVTGGARFRADFKTFC
jgi:hypothetical protein